MHRVFGKVVKQTIPISIGVGGLFIGYKYNLRLTRIETNLLRIEDDIELYKWLRNIKMVKEEENEEGNNKRF